MMIRFLDSQALRTHSRLFKSTPISLANWDSGFTIRREGWLAEDSANDTVERKMHINEIGPIYLILEASGGNSMGSICLSPRRRWATPLREFGDVATSNGSDDGMVWECSEFCLPGNCSKRAASLLAASGRFMYEHEINFLNIVCDQKLQSILGVLGLRTYAIEENFMSESNLYLAIWQFQEEHYSELLKVAGISALEMELYFANSSQGMFREAGQIYT